MNKFLRAGLLACAALAFASAAHAACPTAPTYSTLTGNDATPTPRSLRTWQTGGVNISTPMIGAWNGTAFVQLSANANCALIVDGSGYTQPISPAFAASGVSAVSGTLVSNTLTSAFPPIGGRAFYLELTGTGSVTGAVVYLCNDVTTYAPQVVATDGGSPIVLNKIAYNGGTQNGVRIPISVDQAGMTVKFSPGTVTGTVNFAFVQ